MRTRPFSKYENRLGFQIECQVRTSAIFSGRFSLAVRIFNPVLMMFVTFGSHWEAGWKQKPVFSQCMRTAQHWSKHYITTCGEEPNVYFEGALHNTSPAPASSKRFPLREPGRSEVRWSKPSVVMRGKALLSVPSRIRNHLSAPKGFTKSIVGAQWFGRCQHLNKQTTFLHR